MSNEHKDGTKASAYEKGSDSKEETKHNETYENTEKKGYGDGQGIKPWLMNWLIIGESDSNGGNEQGCGDESKEKNGWFEKFSSRESYCDTGEKKKSYYAVVMSGCVGIER